MFSFFCEEKKKTNKEPQPPVEQYHNVYEFYAQLFSCALGNESAEPIYSFVAPKGTIGKVFVYLYAYILHVYDMNSIVRYEFTMDIARTT